MRCSSGSVEFEDREGALGPAGRMADPWFAIDDACNRALDDERERTWGTPELYDACRSLDVPVLIVDGARRTPPTANPQVKAVGVEVPSQIVGSPTNCRDRRALLA